MKKGEHNPGAYKIINGKGHPERDWQKITEDGIRLVITSSVAMIFAGLVIGAITWSTRAIIADRAETKAAVNELVEASKVQERNLSNIGNRVNDNTILIYQTHKPPMQCPAPLDLETHWPENKK